MQPVHDVVDQLSRRFANVQGQAGMCCFEQFKLTAQQVGGMKWPGDVPAVRQLTRNCPSAVRCERKPPQSPRFRRYEALSAEQARMRLHLYRSDLLIAAAQLARADDQRRLTVGLSAIFRIFDFG